VNKETTHLTKESLKLGTNKDEKPTHLDLFSGIGGFALAAGWAGFETVGFCDNEPYAQAVLKKHWPNLPIHNDIKSLDGTKYRGTKLLTGGFPCQPFSCCGKQRGKEDNRYLWPEMFRIIQEARPTWVVGENVANIVGMALDQVHIDLESKGYQVESVIIPACAVNAQHRRDRVWIIANDAIRGMEGGSKEKICWKSRIQKNQDGRGFQNISELSSISSPRICRTSDGIPNRVDRLKGLGNAIVPQVAYQIIKGIRDLL